MMQEYIEQLAKLNRHEHVVTYQLTHVDPTREPVVGEIRYLMPFVDAVYDPGTMTPLPAKMIAWTGRQWAMVRP
jgi:hypothetical protein